MPGRDSGDSTRGGVAGVVPCAGESTRMGRSKALLDVGGRSFLAAVVTTLREGGCDPVFVICAHGAGAEAREGEAAGAEVLENPDPGEGPITSLRIALERVGEGVAAVAFCPVDHPLVRSDTVATLRRAFAEGDAPLVLPLFERRRGHPALFGRALFAELLDPGLEGGARTVVHRHLGAARLVSVADPGVVADIDTPEAYAEAVAARAHEPGGDS